MATRKQKEPDYKVIRAKLIEDNKISVKSVFVPKSQSRNKDSKDPTLNWKVTLLINDREVITTDYSQGIAHMPEFRWDEKMARGSMSGSDKYHYGSYRDNVAEGGKCFGIIKRNDKREIIAKKFLKWDRNKNDSYYTHNHLYMVPLDPPKTEEVVWSLLMDSSVLDEGGFSDWCSSLGYDDDSMKAKKIYDECMEIALKIRAWFGDKLMSDLREAFQDY